MKKNLIANYVSQFSLALIGILMMPMYIKYMGAETYGLVGFYIMLQAWTQLLDMGMTPTLIRETARFHGGSITIEALKRLIRTLETIFFCITLCTALFSFLFSASLAQSWLNVEHTPLEEVQISIILIVFAVIFRWISGLYRGIISGFERLVWLSVYNTCISIARFILIMPLILWVDSGPITFFSYQLLISIVEIILLKIKTYHLYPENQEKRVCRKKIPFFHWPALRGILRFSTTIAFTTSTWALVTQSDKLILSKILTLTDYAYFTLAVLAASGIGLLGNAAGTALMPRFAKLNAENKEDEIITLYRTATRFVTAITIPASLAMAFFAKPILFAWTGDNEIASQAAKTLSLYSIGTGFLVLNAFPYYLQYAKGNLKLHFIGSILFLVLFLPSLVFMTIQYGIVGAGWSWLAVNGISFFTWTPFIHRKLYPNLHLKWLLTDIGISLVSCLPIAITLNYYVGWSFSRLETFWVLLAICMTLIFSTLIPLLLSQHLIKPMDIWKQYGNYPFR